jgi:hypothetical protein
MPLEQHSKICKKKMFLHSFSLRAYIKGVISIELAESNLTRSDLNPIRHNFLKKSN